MKTLLLACLLGATALAAEAQYAMEWSTIDGGGGTSTGGGYTLAGTIGQPDAGLSSGGNFTLQGGFWDGLGLVPTPGAPWLTVMRTGTNTVVVAWPATDSGWMLEHTNLLTSGSVPWPQIPPPYQTIGSTCVVVVTNVAPANHFFRLHKP